MPRASLGLPKIKPITLGSLYNEKPTGRRKTIPKGVKDDVWGKYIGFKKAEGKCYVCKRPIHITDFEVGHNKAVAKGGKNHINNLRPICKKCNRSMGTMSIETYKKKHYGKPTTKKGTTKKATTKRKTTKRRTTRKNNPFEIHFKPPKF